MAEDQTPAKGGVEKGGNNSPDNLNTPPAGTGQTPASKGGAEQTPGSEEGEGPKLYTQAQLEAMLKDNAGRITKSWAKKNESLAKELEELKAAKLTDPEKQAELIAKLEKANIEKDLQLAEFTSKALKRDMLEKAVQAGRIGIPSTATLSDILDMVSGTDEVEVGESLRRLERLLPPTKPGAPGAIPGTQVGAQPGGRKIYSKQEVLDLQKNPIEYAKVREEIVNQMAEGLIK